MREKLPSPVWLTVVWLMTEAVALGAMGCAPAVVAPATKYCAACQVFFDEDVQDTSWQSFGLVLRGLVHGALCSESSDGVDV